MVTVNSICHAESCRCTVDEVVGPTCELVRHDTFSRGVGEVVSVGVSGNVWASFAIGSVTLV